ncbi:M57 family metalloprotease [bacterium]|jgi:hypothetical protein|nr:M57 family metalloprotease [bacterium]
MESKKIIEILFLLLIISYIFLFAGDFISTYQKILYKINPCPTPITYSIGQFDTQFNITQLDFKLAIKEAEDIWEKASGRDLFNYSSSGGMKVGLIYDSRQESTVQIDKMDNNLDQDNNYYLQLKAQYESLVSQYNQLSQSLNNLISSYNSRQSIYEKKVSIWNKKSGSQSEYNQLVQEREELNSLSSTIKTKQSEVNNLASRINQLAEQLNTLASNLNLNIAKYNDVVESTGQEFEQGNYISGLGEKEINIYQFENHDKLVRVLAHELGHALGIDHIDNSEDIMYAYNIGKNSSITSADLEALNIACPK